MIVLGIDPGTHQVGIALVRRGPHLELLAKERVSLPTRKGEDRRARADRRRAEICGRVVNYLLDHDEHHVDVVAVEDQHQTIGVKLGQGRSKLDGLLVLEIVGAIAATVEEHGRRVVWVAPQQAKRAVLCGGSAGKGAVQEAVQRLMGIQGQLSEHEADAVAVAMGASDMRAAIESVRRGQAS